jgi:hypothetical protein
VGLRNYAIRKFCNVDLESIELAPLEDITILRREKSPAVVQAGIRIRTYFILPARGALES